MLALGLKLLGIGKWIGGFLKSLPWQVYAIVGVIIALLLAWHVHSGWKKAAWNEAFNKGFLAQKKLTDEANGKLRITLKSVRTCVASLDQQNQAVLDLKAASEKKQAEAADAIKTARRASQDAEARARALEASAAGNRAQGACKASAAFVAAREGL